jgi:CheY-like chemotaxis protein
LGLAIIWELVVTLMGGSVVVESTVGQGSRFVVTLNLLPARPRQLPDAAPSLIEPPAARTGLNLLVVDDNAINRRLVTVLLQGAGHRVDMATNGREAVEAAVRVRYDAILMDVQMPVMDGVQATRRIRALPPPHNAVPVIALTADALSDAAQRYRAAGMDAYLSKPLSPATLMTTLETLVRDGRPVRSIADGLPTLDRATIASLRDFLAPDAFARFISESVTDINTRVDGLAARLEVGDLASAAQEAHDLVSAAGNCGARAVSALAREVEQICRRGEGVSPPSAGGIRTAWRSAAEALQALLKS